MRVPIQPDLLRWARERSGLDLSVLVDRFPQLPAWEAGQVQPTLRQLERFARATYTPFGFMFFPEPPAEEHPIPDYRTMADQKLNRLSPHLLDTIYLCQQRQEWYRDWVKSSGEPPLEFVGSTSLTAEVRGVAEKIRDAAGFDVASRHQLPSWTDALRLLIQRIEAIGILVMVSGVVGSNTHRKLNPSEFRGFALADPFAPVIFVNASDTKAAQMFTLAHELAHIWLGQTALSDSQASAIPGHEVEGWCNRVAAEILVPTDDFKLDNLMQRAEVIWSSRNLDRLARRYKVSTLVILRRIRDLGDISEAEFWSTYDSELARLARMPRSKGGNFYLTLDARASRRFTRAIIGSALEGRGSFTDAFRLLGFSKMSTFKRLEASLGYAS